jgi:hypothetical protein
MNPSNNKQVGGFYPPQMGYQQQQSYIPQPVSGYPRQSNSWFPDFSNTFSDFSNPFGNWGSNRPPSVYDTNMNPAYRSYGGKKRYIKSKAKKRHSIKKRHTKKNVKKILNNLKKQQQNISFSQAISG